jgi:glutathione S-transferase
MKLLGAIASPYVRKVRIVMAEKKLDYQFVPEDVWAADTTIGRIQPAGQGALPGHGRRRSAV